MSDRILEIILTYCGNGYSGGKVSICSVPN